MNFEDSAIILDVLVKELFRSKFPNLINDGLLHETILSLYLDFVSDKTGYWTATKTALLMAAQLTAPQCSNPVEAASFAVRIAEEAVKLGIKELKRDKNIIQVYVPLPSMHKPFRPLKKRPKTGET
ncbi:MAG: hypothetical protein LBK13_06760 [Spirochaetales bacterium]|nr:hypothetical protein [Spirochaetales bacterium]